MAIAKLSPDQIPPISVTTPEAISENNKSTFTTLYPEATISSLLKYVEGYPWTVNYYGQILNVNNTLENFDINTPNLTQPYYSVTGLIIQVSTPLTSNYDQNRGITTINGTGIVPYKIIPNIGDIFLAKVDNGEDAIFIINSVTRKTHRKDTLYEVEYNLYSYTSSNINLIPTIESRVQDRYFFNNDTDFFNRDVLIKPTVKEAIDRLKSFISLSQEHYFSAFAQKEVGGIVIPGINSKIYDPLLVDFISRIVDYSLLSDIPFYKYSHNNNKYINQKSIFDLLLNRNFSYLSTINSKFSFISSVDIPGRARLGTMFFAGINYTLFPVNPNTTSDLTETAYINPPFISTIKTSNNYYIPSPDITIQSKNNNNVYTKSVLHELFVNDSYVVSDNFYEYILNNNTYNNISYIELLIYKYLKGEAIAKEDLAITVESYLKWSPLHQLYLLPVLWLIVKANI